MVIRWRDFADCMWYLIVGYGGKKIGERLFDRLPTLSDQVCYCGYFIRRAGWMCQRTVNCA